MRARQFDRRDEKFREVIDRTVRLRHENKEYFNNAKVLRPKKLSVRDLVLLRDSFYNNDRLVLTKFLPKWKGPFRIQSTHEKGWYRLEDLNGTTFRRHTPGNRLKAFHQRTVVELEEIENRLRPPESQSRREEAEVAEEHSESEGEDYPAYGQDIPESAAKKPSRRSARVEQAAKDSLIDLEEQEDLHKAAKKTQRMVAVVPTRRPDFNPKDYQKFPIRE
ncbi:unnamed protein product [Alternaria alternata]